MMSSKMLTGKISLRKLIRKKMWLRSLSLRSPENGLEKRDEISSMLRKEQKTSVRRIRSKNTIRMSRS